MNHELSAFEKWFMARQREKGNQSPSPLIGVEKSIVKTFMLYAATKEET